jgi:hypothetical protein
MMTSLFLLIAPPTNRKAPFGHADRKIARIAVLIEHEPVDHEIAAGAHREAGAVEEDEMGTVSRSRDHALVAEHVDADAESSCGKRRRRASRIATGRRSDPHLLSRGRRCVCKRQQTRQEDCA